MKLAAALVQDEVHSIGKYEPHTHIFFEMADGSYIAFFEMLRGSAPYTPEEQDWARHLTLEVEDAAMADAILGRLRGDNNPIVGPEEHGGLMIKATVLRRPPIERKECYDYLDGNHRKRA